MDVTVMFTSYFDVIAPVLSVAGLLALTISVIVMLINMLIDAFTGKGLHIGSR